MIQGNDDVGRPPWLPCLIMHNKKLAGSYASLAIHRLAKLLNRILIPAKLQLLCIICIYIESYLTENTVCLHYKGHSVNGS